MELAAELVVNEVDDGSVEELASMYGDERGDEIEEEEEEGKIELNGKER